MPDTAIFLPVTATLTAMVICAVAWLLIRTSKARDAADSSRDIAVMNERLQAADASRLTLQERIQTLETEKTGLQSRLDAAHAVRATLEANLENERTNSKEKLALLEESRKRLEDSFKVLSADALQSSNQSFLQLATESLKSYQESAKGDLEKRQQAITELVKPISDSLAKVDGKIAELEKERAGAYASLTEQVKSLATTQVQLQTETANLVKALRAPQVRGRWGEIQLQRVVEMAGMVEYCDFQQQESVTTGEGRLRPDLVVKLPGGKNVVVDAKCPLQAYLEALSASEETIRQKHLKLHADQVNEHISQLARKSYWDQFQPTPEFVVLFLPGETFFSAALEQRPELIEAGADKKVILATPTTLIALLRAVAYGWRQEQIARNAQEISELGKRVYEGVRVFSEHFTKVGASLESVVGHYNNAVGSLERNFLPSARKFKDLGSGSDKPIAELDTIETSAREFKTAELVDSPPNATL
jgi:DNA recombination protein RmuC